MVYDAQSRSELDNGQPFPNLNSLRQSHDQRGRFDRHLLRPGHTRREGEDVRVFDDGQRRAIDMAPTLRAALARLPSRFQGGLIFCSADGKPIDPDNFAHRDWARILRRADLRRIRFHDLRHTYASLLMAQGAHAKYIQA
jgi:integrase